MKSQIYSMGGAIVYQTEWQGRQFRAIVKAGKPTRLQGLHGDGKWIRYLNRHVKTVIALCKSDLQ